MDMQISADGNHLYCLDSNGFLGNIGGDPSAAAKLKTNELYLQYIQTDHINFDPKKKPALYQRPAIVPPKDPVPRMMNPVGSNSEMRKPPSSSSRGYDSAYSNNMPAVKGKAPSILASNGLSLLGTSAQINGQIP